LNPFPLFEDGNFFIPSAFVSKTAAEKIMVNRNFAKLKISSKTDNSVSHQIIASKGNNGKRVLIDN